MGRWSVRASARIDPSGLPRMAHASRANCSVRTLSCARCPCKRTCSARRQTIAIRHSSSMRSRRALLMLELAADRRREGSASTSRALNKCTAAVIQITCARHRAPTIRSERSSSRVSPMIRSGCARRTSPSRARPASFSTGMTPFSVRRSCNLTIR